jgi:hypothetical protein
MSSSDIPYIAKFAIDRISPNIATIYYTQNVDINNMLENFNLFLISNTYHPIDKKRKLVVMGEEKDIDHYCETLLPKNGNYYSYRR